MTGIKDGYRFLKIPSIVFLCFAIRGISDGMLAFTSSNYSPWFGTFVSLFVYATLPLGVIYVLKKQYFEKSNLYLCIIPILFFMLLMFNTYNGYSGFWLTALVAIVCFMLMSSNDKASIFRITYVIVQAQNLISVIFYICVLLHINIGYSIVPYYTGLTGCSYYKFGIFAILQQGISQWRLCGIFNEPGGLGTICAFMFIVCFDTISKKEKLLLLLTIAFTFSLAGYLLVFIFISIHLVEKDKKYIPLIILFGCLFFVIPNIDFGNDSLNYLVHRLQLTDSGLAGDNRYHASFDAFYNEFKKSGHAAFGYGYGYPDSRGISTYKSWIVQFGYIGFFGYLGVIVSAALLKAEKNASCIQLIILFIISIYQRPLAISGLYGFIILFGGIEYIKRMSTTRAIYNAKE